MRKVIPGSGPPPWSTQHKASPKSFTTTRSISEAEVEAVRVLVRFARSYDHIYDDDPDNVGKCPVCKAIYDLPEWTKEDPKP